MRDDLHIARSFGLNFHILKDADGLYLIDGGFIGGLSLLRRALKERGWERLPIRGIIVTHGHLDHILNIRRIAEESRAWIAAPRLDLPHYEGKPEYHGLAKIGGSLECLGRATLGYRPFTPTRLLDHGDTIDIWHGFKVVHLPGHTAGHSGYYCERQKLLFCADLFASFGSLSHFPPNIFNSSRNLIAGSVAKGLSLELEGLLPNHAYSATPAEHLERLRWLAHKIHPNPCASSQIQK
jgi:glyoxylase-like metal-dependent hydrolase (beta-lactamase superfamily II)